MQPTPNVLGAPANGLLGRWGGSKYNQLNPTALSGMTAWYDANERNTLFVDASGRTSVVSNRAEDGGDRFLYLNGASGTYASTPDSAALSITGDIDIRAQIAFANATPNTYQTFIGKWTTTGNQFAYSLDIAANNRINLYWSTNGSNALLVQSTVAPTFVVNQPIWIRATLDVDNGSGGYSVQFFTSSDGSSWTQLGSTVTQAGVTSIFDSTAILEIGSNRVGSTDRMSGRFYRVQIYNGINGTLAFDANFSTHTTGSAPLTESANGAVVSFLGNARVTYVGPTNCLALNGVVGNHASTPDASVLRVTGNIELEADIMIGALPASRGWIIAKWANVDGKRSYGLTITSSNGLELIRSTDGTSATISIIQSTANLPYSLRTRFKVRATFNTTTGVAQFFTSLDGVTWTQLGTNVVVGAGGFFAGSEELRIGNQVTGSELFSGNVYRAVVRNGIGGTAVFDANFTTAPKLANSFTESSANAATVTINSTGDLGARIAGEKDLVQLTLTKQPIYLPWSGTNYSYINGTSGSYISTPDSAGVSVTGDIDLRWYGRLPSYAATQVLISKSQSAGQRSYSFYAASGGSLGGEVSLDGTAVVTGTSSAHNIPADTDIWFRMTRASATGTFAFFTSTDGTTWTAVGGSTTTSGPLFDGTSPLAVGSFGSFNMTGRTFRAQVLNGIGGTVVADFNPSRYTSGTTFTASTGEVWTLNGGSTIVNRTSLYFDGSDDYMKAPAFSLSQPETVYFVGQQVSWTSGDVLWAGGTNGAGVLYQETSTPGLAIYPGVSSTATNNGMAIGTTAIATSIVNGASSALRINRGTATTGGSGVSAANGFTLASNGNGGVTPANIRTNEVAIYAAAHDTATQDRWALYAGKKWGFGT